MPSHTGFIVAAYAVTALVLAATVMAVVLDYRAQRRAIARLSARSDDSPGARPGDPP